jgi:hypothetical protein
MQSRRSSQVVLAKTSNARLAPSRRARLKASRRPAVLCQKTHDAFLCVPISAPSLARQAHARRVVMESSSNHDEWRGVDMLGNDLAMRPCSQESRRLIRRQLIGSVAVAIAIAVYAGAIALTMPAAPVGVPTPVASAATPLNSDPAHFPAGQSLSTRSNAWEKPAKE